MFARGDAGINEQEMFSRFGFWQGSQQVLVKVRRVEEEFGVCEALAK